jgi:hypothetical protein
MVDDSDEWGKPPPLESTPVPLLKRLGSFVAQNIFNLIIIGFFLLLLGGWWLLSRGPNVSRANYDRISQGMSESDVYSILGPDTGLDNGFAPPEAIAGGKLPPVWKMWRNQNGAILICFVDQRVRWSRFMPPP